jgi:hypothetical protein
MVEPLQSQLSPSFEGTADFIESSQNSFNPFQESANGRENQSKSENKAEENPCN